MHLFRIIMMGLLLFAVLPGLEAQTSKGRPGWLDRNRDGINDRFVDADGDGRNDLNNVAYTMPFPYEDKNGDGVNDLWKDADGDGVNDYLGAVLKSRSRWTDLDGDGIMDRVQGSLRGRALMRHVLDMNGDMKNDITGLAYNGKDIQGYRYGNVDEETGRVDLKFTDDNGDGMNDRFLTPERRNALAPGRMDRFFDADGDGIADDRGFQRLRGSGRGRGKK